MCRLIEKTKRKSFTGYKVAYKKRGKYYSPSTGLLYVPGKVPEIKKVEKIAEKLNLFKNVFEGEGGHFYNRLMEGRTSVFESSEDAELLLNAITSTYNKFCILEMKLSGDVYSGKFLVPMGSMFQTKDTNIFSGTHIDSIKEI